MKDISRAYEVEIKNYDLIIDYHVLQKRVIDIKRLYERVTKLLIGNVMIIKPGCGYMFTFNLTNV